METGADKAIIAVGSTFLVLGILAVAVTGFLLYKLYKESKLCVRILILSVADLGISVLERMRSVTTIIVYRLMTTIFNNTRTMRQYSNRDI